MNENLLVVGTKIELIKMTRQEEDAAKKKTTYVSQIIDFKDESIICAMPIFEGHLVPLEIGSEFDVYFYIGKNIYTALCKVENRGKEENIYFCQLKRISALKKVQRREFYRLQCTMQISITQLTKGEILSYLEKRKIPDKLENDSDKGIIIDISGGGIRAVTSKKYEKNAFVVVEFNLDNLTTPKKMTLLAQIVQSFRYEKDNKLIDQRIRFREISRDVQDEIVKYIFDEQRKIRKKEKGK